MNLKPYKTRYSTNEYSIFKNVPIAQLDAVRAFFKSHGVKVRIRFRGPRNTPADMNRSYATRQASCLKQNANRFTVYLGR